MISILTPRILTITNTNTTNNNTDNNIPIAIATNTAIEIHPGM